MNAEMLGERIRRLRDAHQWTLKDLATRSFMSVSYLSDIERGRTPPSLKTLVRIARSLDMTPSQLLDDVDLSVYGP